MHTILNCDLSNFQSNLFSVLIELFHGVLIHTYKAYPMEIYIMYTRIYIYTKIISNPLRIKRENGDKKLDPIKKSKEKSLRLFLVLSEERTIKKRKLLSLKRWITNIYKST